MSRCIARRWGCRDRGGESARRDGSMCDCRDGVCTTPASGGCTPPFIASPTIGNEAISGLPCHGICREIRVPCTGSGPIRGRGEQRRRRGGARSRAPPLLTHGPCPSAASLWDAAASWPCAPAPSSATKSARRADRDTGPESVQGARTSRATLDTRHSVRAAGPLGPGCRDPGYSVGRFQSPPRAATRPTDAASRRPRMLSAVIRFVSIAVRAVSTSRYPAVPLRY